MYTGSIPNPVDTSSSLISQGLPGDDFRPSTSTSFNSQSRKRTRDQETFLSERDVKKAKKEELSFKVDDKVYEQFYKTLNSEKKRQVLEKLNQCKGSSPEEVKAFEKKYDLELKIGSALSYRGAFWSEKLKHVAVYIGYGKVVEFTGGTSEGLTGTVEIDSLSKFVKLMPLKDACVYIQEPSKSQDLNIVLARAFEEVGNKGYNFLRRNCETVANGITTGEYKSAQAEGVLSAADAVSDLLAWLAGASSDKRLQVVRTIRKDILVTNDGLSQLAQNVGELGDALQGRGNAGLKNLVEAYKGGKKACTGAANIGKAVYSGVTGICTRLVKKANTVQKKYHDFQ